VPHVAHFLAEPLDHLPARRPGSIRRTSHVDMIRGAAGGLELRGAAADPLGGQATCRALVGPDRSLSGLDLDPGVIGSDGLLGRLVGRGFRAAVDAICPPGTLPSVLLSELPVAALLSGYASLYTGEFPSPIPDAVVAGFPVDICAGWAAPASFMVQIRTERTMPTPNGPVAPDLGGPDGDVWHDMPALAPGSMRRQRLIERTGMDVWAMFRDSYARPDGVVTVLHEYSVAATLASDDSSDESSDERVASCVSTPRVLPWAECPSAAGSAGRLVGRRVVELRQMVKDEMVGTSTCTHLNDLLSSLSQASVLVG
jgi:hypothetical protein